MSNTEKAFAIHLGISVGVLETLSDYAAREAINAYVLAVYDDFDTRRKIEREMIDRMRCCIANVS